MKRIVMLLLTVCIALSFVGCQKYEPQESTALEKTKVASLRYGKKEYTVNYELFRMLFLSAKITVSGDDLSRFEGSEGAALLEEARALALDRMYEIYSVLALCEVLDIDLYARAVNKKVEESITLSIEGGIGADDQEISGLGSYEAYLENLKKVHFMNYAVQDLLIRYSYGISAIGTHYRGTYDEYGILKEEGKLKYTDADVTAFYNSADTYRILLGFTQREESRAQQLRDLVASKTTEEEISFSLIANSTANEADAKHGLVIGKHTLDNSVYSAVTEAAFALEEGEVSALIPGNHNGYNGYFILYRAEKNAQNLKDNRERIAKYYVENEIGKRYAEVKDALMKSATFTDFYKGLNLTTIRMDEEEK